MYFSVETAVDFLGHGDAMMPSDQTSYSVPGTYHTTTPTNQSENIKVINLAMSIYSPDGNNAADTKHTSMLETFHTPSFGDESFDIPLSMPAVSQPCYSQQQAYGNRAQQNSHPYHQQQQHHPQQHQGGQQQQHHMGGGGGGGQHPQQPGPHHQQHPGAMTNFHFNNQPPSSQNLHNSGHHAPPPFGLQQNNGGQPGPHPPHRLKHESDPASCFEPQFPPPTFEIPDIQVSNSVLMHMVDGKPLESHHLMSSSNHNHHQGGPPRPDNHIFQKPLPQNVLQTLGGFASPGGQGKPGQGGKVASPGAPGSTNTSPSRDSVSEDSSSEDSLPLAQVTLQMAMKRGAPESPVPPPPTPSAKKPKTPKKRKKKDPNEPQKPVSAYALFFRDTQAAIKSQNPNASFGEVSKIVASMWDTLDDEHKSAYKKRTETAKKEYLKQLAAYRASLVSQGALEPQDSDKPKMGVPYQPIQRSSLPNPAMTSPSMTLSMSQMPLSITSPLSRMVSSPMMMNAQTTLMQGPPGMPGMPPQSQQQHQQQQHTMVHMTNIAPRLAAQQMAPSAGMNPMGGGPPFSMGNQQQMMGSPNNMGMGSPNGSMCTRQGCPPNPPMDNPGWDNDYCSNESVVNHCRDAFSEWVSTRESNGPHASVK